MTNDELTNAFTAAGFTSVDELTAALKALRAFPAKGFDTQEKTEVLLGMAGAQMKRNALLIALDGLAQKQAASANAINAERSALQSQINDLTAQITAAAQ